MWKFLFFIFLWFFVTQCLSSHHRVKKVSKSLLKEDEGTIRNFVFLISQKLDLLSKNIEQIGRNIVDSFDLIFTTKIQLIREKLQQILGHFGCMRAEENPKTGIIIRSSK